MRVHRVLVTGSRDWYDVAQVWAKLDFEASRAQQSGLAMVVVHGKCPTGGDKMADDWVKARASMGWPVTVEQHPADWNTLGRKAGPLRNRHMVSLGADVVLAFILDGSGGASGCVEEAKGARLLVDVTKMASGALTAS